MQSLGNIMASACSQLAKVRSFAHWPIASNFGEDLELHQYSSFNEEYMDSFFIKPLIGKDFCFSRKEGSGTFSPC